MTQKSTIVSTLGWCWKLTARSLYSRDSTIDQERLARKLKSFESTTWTAVSENSHQSRCGSSQTISLFNADHNWCTGRMRKWLYFIAHIDYSKFIIEFLFTSKKWRARSSSMAFAFGLVQSHDGVGGMYAKIIEEFWGEVPLPLSATGLAWISCLRDSDWNVQNSIDCCR